MWEGWKTGRMYIHAAHGAHVAVATVAHVHVAVVHVEVVHRWFK